MKYDIYFHGGCFDGVASAAMLLWFLRQRGDSYGKFIPLTHPVNKKWWKSLKMEHPSAIVDILYHPKAKIWFDHHPTTFIDKKWEKNFQPDLWHQLETKSPSCTGLIYRYLTKNFKVKFPKYLKELAYWTDITDRANYKSAKEAFNLKPPAIQLGYYLDSLSQMSVARHKSLINFLNKESISFVVRKSWIRNGILRFKKRFERSFPKTKEKMTLFGNTVFLENLKRELAGTRYASYYFYPKSNYSMRFTKHGETFVLSVGVNPWHKPKNPARIGQFLEKNYGGGGHAYAGAAPFKNKKDALAAVEKITAYLNKHG